MSTTDGPARQLVIQHVDGPLELQAWHGTGKTTLLLERFARLVSESHFICWHHRYRARA